MASSVSLPNFEYREKLLHTKLNAAMAAINARFTAGIGTADLAWPLTAEGNLDMSAYNIINGRQIWGQVNAASYTTLALAVAAAGAGGVVVVPPETTITSDGGVAITNLGAIIGSGPSSVLKLSGSASAGTLLTSGGGTYLLLSNLTLDGSSVASQVGLELKGVTGVILHNVWFKNFGGAALKISDSCDGVFLNNGWFSGGSAEHIYATHSGVLCLANVQSSSAGTIAVRMEAAGASSYIYAHVDGLRITGAGTSALKMLGTAAPGSANPVEFYGNNIQVTTNGGGVNSVILGTASAGVHKLVLSNTSISSSVAGGLLVNASSGALSNVIVDDPTTFCIDLDVSQYVTVDGCVLRDGTIGIDGSGCTAECVAQDNVFEGCTADLVFGANFWGYGKNAVRTWIEDTDFTFTANAVTTYTLRTFPAYSVKPGDTLLVEFVATCSGNQNASHNITPKFGTQGLIAVRDAAGGAQVGGITSMIVRTTSTGVTAQHGWSAAAGAGYSSSGACTIDTTTAQDLTLVGTFSSDATSSASLKFLRVTHFSGAVV